MIVYLLATLLATFTVSQSAREVMAKAVADFRAGRVEQSAAGFDQLARLVPDQAPELWQRGIAQYYAGRFRDCRDMFISHRTVNPDDVENAAWHFLCVARAESPEAARKQILPVGPDARVPMREVYEMFQGRAAPAQVLAAAGSDLSAQFFGQLYVGLYLDVTGDRRKGREHVAIAAQPRFASVGGYMHDVARVHMMVPR
jgi:lipoprotein NlpI